MKIYDHIAWCRYTHDDSGAIKSIVTCNSNAKGAFKVYRITPADFEQLAALRSAWADNEKWQRAAGHWKARHEVMESRLAQVEQERDNAATQMRNQCVARVREYLRHAKVDLAPLISDLESLTIDTSLPDKGDGGED